MDRRPLSRERKTVRGAQGLGLRQFLFRAAAILIGLLLVLLFEVLLRLTHLGRSTDIDDPYVGFSEIRPLFVLNAATDRYQIPNSRHSFFRPDSFAAVKPPHEFRIFVLGGSTVQGRPYSIETSFTTWLELSLTAADPSQSWEVVNCGGVSYASYRLLPIMKELLLYQPNLLILYTGHNEFLEERTYAHLKRRPRWIKSAYDFVAASRLYRLISQLHSATRSRIRGTAPREVMSAEANAILDYEHGLDEYQRDDTWQLGVLNHFEQNLRRMVGLAKTAGIPMLLVNPVSNLKHTPPFKSQPSADLTSEQRAEFKELWLQARDLDWSQLDRKSELLKRALAIDDRHADAHFLLARVYEVMGEAGLAKAEYLRAKDEDVCPLRMLESMHAITVRVASSTSTPLIDIRRMFEDFTEDGIPGDEQLIDHVHPRIEGHQQIAERLFSELARMKTLAPQPGWRSRQKELYDERWRTLDHNYFPESRARLEGLQLWTQGRATRLKSADRPH